MVQSLQIQYVKHKSASVKVIIKINKTCDLILERNLIL